MKRIKYLARVLLAGFLGTGLCLSGIALTGGMTTSIVYADEGVEINKQNFPDENFRKYVSYNIDTNWDGKLSAGEISECYKIDCDGEEILSLKGIEYFTELEGCLAEKTT